jgi:hypothetical protein
MKEKNIQFFAVEMRGAGPKEDDSKKELNLAKIRLLQPA